MKWTSALVREGILRPAEVEEALACRSSAMRVVRRAMDRVVQSEIERLAAAIGLSASDVTGEPLWALMPTYLTDLDVTECPGAVLHPDTVDESFSYIFPLTIDHHGFSQVSRALGALKMQSLFVVAPHELCTEGFCGSMLYADLNVYSEQAVDADGNVHLDDDLIEHLSSEYGMDVNGDEDTRERVVRMFKFIRLQATHFAKIGKLAKEVSGIRASARNAPTPALRATLDRVADLLAIAPQRRPSGPEINVQSLSEESYFSGAVVFVGDLAGSEAEVLDEVCDLNMQIGGSMESLLDGPDLGALATVALREIAFTTVLATVLTHYAGAANDLADSQARPVAA